MANTITSPNMGMPVPVPTVDPGPDWASNLVLCLGILDPHNHTQGNGVPVPSSGLNINSDLTFGVHNATDLRSARFSVQASPLSLGTDLACAAAVGTAGDLYWNDANGNQIQMTANGGIAGSPGSIANLTSPASASWVSADATFVWQSAVSTAANMDSGSLVLRYPGSYPSPAGNCIVLQVPSSISSGYAITLPALPVATYPLSISASGVMSAAQLATAQIANLAVTAAKIANATITTTQISATAGILGTQLANSADILGAQIDANVIFTTSMSLVGGAQIETRGVNYGIDSLGWVLGYGVGSGNGSRMVYGSVASNGSLTQGSGVTTSKTATGAYNITPDIASSSGFIVPIVICESGALNMTIVGKSTTVVQIQIKNSSATNTDGAFDFVLFVAV